MDQCSIIGPCDMKQITCRVFKQVAITTNSNVNILKSVCIRNQLQLAYMKLNPNILTGPSYNQAKEIDTYCRIKYFIGVPEEEIIMKTDLITVRGVTYKLDSVLVINIGDESLLFGRIIDMFVKSKEVFALIQPLHFSYFEDHLHAYHVIEGPISILRKISELLDIQPCALLKRDNLLYVVPKHSL